MLNVTVSDNTSFSLYETFTKFTTNLSTH